MKKEKEYSEKYFAALKKFNLSPDFKLSDYEKEVVKYIDKTGTVTVYDLSDVYDLRPSEAKELLADLSDKGVLNVNEETVSLSEPAIRYLHATKESRKTEKKFRKFLNTLEDKDIDRLMELVNSFEVKEEKEVKEDQSEQKEGE